MYDRQGRVHQEYVGEVLEYAEFRDRAKIFIVGEVLEYAEFRAQAKI